VLINLHSHLEGRVRPATAAALAQRAGVPEPAGGWEQAIQLDGPADLTVYLEKVASTYPLFTDLDAVARICAEAVEDAAAEGLDFLELRFGPATHTAPGRSIDDVLAAACAGLTDAVARTGMPAGLVPAALRHHDPETNDAVARAAARHAGRGVVGFDLAGDELRFPHLSPYVTAFGIARAAGLGITCHAAEAAPGPAAREAVERFGATRIGHGAHIASDPATLGWAADEGVVIEVCPTSNWYTGAIGAVVDHPAPVFAAAGIPLVLGDDNPMQTRSSLPAERAVLTDQLGFTDIQLAALDRTSVAAMFADDSVRAVLRSRLGTAS
jgi:adenosine deaminase